MNRFVNRTVGTALSVRDRSERGLSQSTENAILLAGAVVIAAGIVALVGAFVSRQLAGLG